MTLHHGLDAEIGTESSIAGLEAGKGPPYDNCESVSVVTGHHHSSDNVSFRLRQRKPVSLGRFLALCFGFMAISLQDPFVSLTSTIAIGRHDASGLASLGLGVQLSDGFILMFLFLPIAATRLYVNASFYSGRDEMLRIIGNVFWMSGFFGLIALFIMRTFAERILYSFADVSSRHIIPDALIYMKIRALGIPASIFCISAKSLLMAQDNIASNITSSTLCFFINLAGILFFVNRMDYGISGAALSTVLAHFGSLCYLVIVLLGFINETNKGGFFSQSPTKWDSSADPLVSRFMKRNRRSYGTVSAAINDAAYYADTDVLRKEREACSKRQAKAWKSKKFAMGLNHGVYNRIFAPPNCKEVGAFLGFLIPCTIQFCSRVVIYGLMAQNSSMFGTVGLAAHQVITNLFSLFSVPSESLSQASQALIPSQKNEDCSIQSRTQAVSLTKADPFSVIEYSISYLKIFAFVACLFGFVFSSTAYVLTRYASPLVISDSDSGLIALLQVSRESAIFIHHFRSLLLISHNEEVMRVIEDLSPSLFLSLVFLPLVGISEGNLLAFHNLLFLTVAYICLSIVPSLILSWFRYAKHSRMLVLGYPVTMMAVWKIFAVYQLCRAAVLFIGFLRKIRHRNVYKN